MYDSAKMAGYQGFYGLKSCEVTLVPVQVRPRAPPKEKEKNAATATP